MRITIVSLLCFFLLFSLPGFSEVGSGTGKPSAAFMTEKSKELLKEAAEGSLREKFDALIAEGANINFQGESGETPLLTAINGHHFETARILLELGADPNLADTEGDTPLHRASWVTSKEATEAILKSGAKLDPVNRQGFTPLHLALKQYSEPVGEVLINSGASVNARTSESRTPLHFAARHLTSKCVEQLLSKGAEVNSADANGETPLHLATKLHCRETAIALVKGGANFEAKASDGRTPLHNAILMGQKTFDLLLKLSKKEKNLVTEFPGEKPAPQKQAKKGKMIFTDMADSLLLGGFKDGSWLDNDEVLPHVKSGELFSIFDLRGKLGTGVATDPHEIPELRQKGLGIIPSKSIPVPRNDSNEEKSLSRYAISAPWDPQPRKVTLKDPSKESYRGLVEAFLEKIAIAGVPPVIERVIETDLEDDGKAETFIQVNSKEMNDDDERFNQGYSLLLLVRQKGGKREVTPFWGEVYTNQDDLDDSAHVQLLTILDFNGDGIMEVLIGYGKAMGEIYYYEIMTLQNNDPVVLYGISSSADWG